MQVTWWPIIFQLVTNIKLVNPLEASLPKDFLLFWKENLAKTGEYGILNQ